MAEMAKWGELVFKVNSNQVFSFRKMKRSYSGRWAAHNIIGDRPKMEFQGPEMDEITLEIILDAELGVTPRVILKRLRLAAKNGEVEYFYVGGRKMGANKFYIASGTENWNEIWNEGELVRATASVTFREYV